MRYFLGVVACIFVLTIPPSAHAQDDRTIAFQTAMQNVAQGQVEQAIHMLDSLLALHPDFARAWSGLGLAHRTNGDNLASLKAFQKGIDLDPSNSTTMYNLGIAFALLEVSDGAFEWLLKAKSSNTVNLNNFDGLPAATNIREDSRYSSLFPSEEEMSDPFMLTCSTTYA